MRRKYNVFDISKINKKTIELALQLKKEHNGYKEAFLKDPENNNVPVDENKFLEFISVKYLQLRYEDGIPLLKQAHKKQYKVEDEYKKCRQCNKIFRFTRKSKDFCSDRCRQRFYRNQKREEKKSSMLR